jgi:hypothetical protein
MWLRTKAKNPQLPSIGRYATEHMSLSIRHLEGHSRTHYAQGGFSPLFKD